MSGGKARRTHAACACESTREQEQKNLGPFHVGGVYIHTGSNCVKAGLRGRVFLGPASKARGRSEWPTIDKSRSTVSGVARCGKRGISRAMILRQTVHTTTTLRPLRCVLLHPLLLAQAPFLSLSDDDMRALP